METTQIGMRGSGEDVTIHKEEWTHPELAILRLEETEGDGRTPANLNGSSPPP